MLIKLVPLCRVFHNNNHGFFDTENEFNPLQVRKGSACKPVGMQIYRIAVTPHKYHLMIMRVEASILILIRIWLGDIFF